MNVLSRALALVFLSLMILLVALPAQAVPPSVSAPLSPSAISTAGGELRGPNPHTMVIGGDSFAAYNGTPDTNCGSATALPVFGANCLSYSQGMAMQTNLALGSPWHIVSINGVVGDRADQCAARMDAMLATGAGWLWWTCNGTNDPYQGYTAEQIEATLDAAFAKALAKGVKIILPLDLPRGGTYTQANIRVLIQVQRYLFDKYTTVPGVYVLNGWGIMADRSTIANAYNGIPYSAYYKTDLIHPNIAGAQVLAEFYATQLAPVVTSLRYRSFAGSDGNTNGDPTILTRNPQMAGTAGYCTGTAASGVCADNLYMGRTAGTGITCVGSKATRASLAATYPKVFGDGQQGSVQVMTMANAVAATDLCYLSQAPSLSAAAFSAAYSGTGYYVVTADVGATATSGTISALDVGCQFTIAGQGSWLATANYNVDSGDYLGLTTFQRSVISRPFYIPANLDTSTAMFCQVRAGTSAGGAGSVAVSNLALVKLQY